MRAAGGSHSPTSSSYAQGIPLLALHPRPDDNDDANDEMAEEKVGHDVENELHSPASNDSRAMGGHAPEKVLKHSHDADMAMKAFVGFEGETLVLDEATNRRLLRKIDLNVMPVLPSWPFHEMREQCLTFWSSCFALFMA